MAGSKSPIATLIIVVLALALLYALNPSTEDFQAWQSTLAENRATSGMASDKGTLEKGIARIAGAIDGAVAGVRAGLYSRKDYLVCSSYSLEGHRYLGIAHFFIKLK
jgi:hypothetical protein